MICMHGVLALPIYIDRVLSEICRLVLVSHQYFCVQNVILTRSVYFSYVASLPVDPELTLEFTVAKSV